MSKMLAVLAIGFLAVLAVQAIVVAEDGVVVNVNPAPGAPTKAQVIGERMQLAGGGCYGAFVPPVPTPPGVLGQYSPLPCAIAYPARMGTGFSTDYLLREWGETQ